MSILIDKLIDETKQRNTRTEFTNKFGRTYYFESKPCELFDIRTRVKDAWRVLTGKSRAYHYMVDE